MTCIVGLVDGESVYIGADSAASSGWDIRSTALSKVFRTGRFLIGYTSSFRMGQILQYHLNVPDQQIGESDLSYMVTVFVETVRSTLKTYGFSHVEHNQESGGEFLVGYNGHLYHVTDNFQVNCFEDGYDAVGCGAPYALGAMCAYVSKDPVERVITALGVSAHFSNGVRGPFEVLHI